MSNSLPTDALPPLSLESQHRIASGRFYAQRDVGNILDGFWYQLPASQQPRAGEEPRAQEILMSYAIKLFDLAACEYAAVSTDPEKLAEHYRTLCARICLEMRQLRIPQCQFLLQGGPWGKGDFRERLEEELSEHVKQLSSQANRKLDRTKINKLIAEWALAAGVTKSAKELLARKSNVDSTVIRALCRGEKKCSLDGLERVAKVLGCSVADLGG